MKVQIVKDSAEAVEHRNNRRKDKSEQIDDDLDRAASIEDFVSPFQTLITDLNKDETLNKSIESLKRKINALRSENSNEKKKKAMRRDSEEDSKSADELSDQEVSDDEIEIDESGINTYAQEVLCKDNLETEEKAALGRLL